MTAKKKGLGLSQKKQIEIINDFKDGKHNVLVMSSVGEEGLDIPSVDLVIFYEPIPSAIRTIQRRGRTGRHESGKVIVLMALMLLETFWVLTWKVMPAVVFMTVIRYHAWLQRAALSMLPKWKIFIFVRICAASIWKIWKQAVWWCSPVIALPAATWKYVISI